MTEYFKVLGLGLTSYHGGKGKWTVGRWRSVRGELRVCKNGLHFVTLAQLPLWLGPVICRFEPAGGTKTIATENKFVCRKGRIGKPLETWNERTQRLFAADCAEHILGYFESKYPEDARPREAIAVARRYANGEASADELRTAYSAAYSASSAARGAARGAASSAEQAWQAGRLAFYLGIESGVDAP